MKRILLLISLMCALVARGETPVAASTVSETDDGGVVDDTIERAIPRTAILKLSGDTLVVKLNYDRPVTASYMLLWGGSSLADTYLSPITYHGSSLTLAYERMQAMKFDPERWTMRYWVSAEVDKGRNLADNASMWRLEGDFSWGILRKWSFPRHRLTLMAGGEAEASAGCLYSSRNGNNPVSVKAAVTVGLTGAAVWQTHLWRLPLTLRYQASLPSLGVYFSPEYDELYYEIYLGNDKGLARVAYPLSRFAMTNLLVADLHFGSTSLRVGYRGYVMTSKASNLTTNVCTNSIVIGITGEWLSLPSRRTGNRAVISAY